MNINEAKEIILILKSGKTFGYSVMYDGIRVVFEFIHESKQFRKTTQYAYGDDEARIEEFEENEFIIYLESYNYKEFLKSRC